MKNRGDVRHKKQARSSANPQLVRAVVLVGFMGAGKSSVGRALGRQLGWPFEDLDERIEQRESQAIAEIFRVSGEAVFRRIEHVALRKLLAERRDGSGLVVALGGGAFAGEENIALIAECGSATVFLDAPVEELWRRCQQQAQEGVNRPLLAGADQFRELHQARMPHFMKASLRLETNGKEIEAIALEVAECLKKT